MGKLVLNPNSNTVEIWNDPAIAERALAALESSPDIVCKHGLRIPTGNFTDIDDHKTDIYKPLNAEGVHALHEVFGDLVPDNFNSVYEVFIIEYIWQNRTLFDLYDCTTLTELKNRYSRALHTLESIK